MILDLLLISYYPPLSTILLSLITLNAAATVSTHASRKMRAAATVK